MSPHEYLLTIYMLSLTQSFCKLGLCLLKIPASKPMDTPLFSLMAYPRCEASCPNPARAPMWTSSGAIATEANVNSEVSFVLLMIVMALS
jgi:hypothetical protein